MITLLPKSTLSTLCLVVVLGLFFHFCDHSSKFSVPPANEISNRPYLFLLVHLRSSWRRARRSRWAAACRTGSCPSASTDIAPSRPGRRSRAVSPSVPTPISRPPGTLSGVPTFACRSPPRLYEEAGNARLQDAFKDLRTVVKFREGGQGHVDTGFWGERITEGLSQQIFHIFTNRLI